MSVVDPTLAAQLGAFLGTTFVIYRLTTPSKDTQKHKAEQSKSPNVFVSGAKRYSPIHRQQSTMRRNNLSSDVLAVHGLTN
eukprot:CAMPEP_0181028946 /NCGR_PEP_ID=MMETSP1070-20121207/4936_1 /TAXON_ID=265543 /ORGANISM="Minutocellus polymorphus, Strain NH13" /LENGTH=80 /DNA_ID=CAMNT_0023106223 /DNA_START=117 /DNA_END=359 /DNA_ORIENTATION=+